MKKNSEEKNWGKILEPSKKFASEFVRNVDDIPNKELKKIKKANKAFDICLLSGIGCSFLTTPLIIATIVCAINANGVEKQMEKSLYTETEEYKTIYKSEIESLEARFENGELSGTEYLQLVKTLGSDEYVEAAMKKSSNLPSAKETSQVKESNSKTLATGLCAVGSFAAALGLTQAGVRIGKHGDKKEKKFREKYPFYKNAEFYR